MGARVFSSFWVVGSGLCVTAHRTHRCACRCNNNWVRTCARGAPASIFCLGELQGRERDGFGFHTRYILQVEEFQVLMGGGCRHGRCCHCWCSRCACGHAVGAAACGVPPDDTCSWRHESATRSFGKLTWKVCGSTFLFLVAFGRAGCLGMQHGVVGPRHGAPLTPCTPVYVAGRRLVALSTARAAWFIALLRASGCMHDVCLWFWSCRICSLVSLSTSTSEVWGLCSSARNVRPACRYIGTYWPLPLCIRVGRYVCLSPLGRCNKHTGGHSCLPGFDVLLPATWWRSVSGTCTGLGD